MWSITQNNMKVLSVVTGKMERGSWSFYRFLGGPAKSFIETEIACPIKLVHVLNAPYGPPVYVDFYCRRFRCAFKWMPVKDLTNVYEITDQLMRERTELTRIGIRLVPFTSELCLSEFLGELTEFGIPSVTSLTFLRR